MKNRTANFIIVVMVLTTISGITGNKPVTAENTKIEDAGFKNHWYENWDEGMEAAKTENKPVLIDFMSDHCGACVAMEKNTFAAPEIKERLMSGWICIKINTSHSGKEGTFDGKTMNYYKLSKYFRVTGVPTFVFLDKELKP
ncbi:MAG: thioredoxin family protein, partial [Candidatus Latescibacteria bacterium]|nr:thioredoxin family protein [Candidatus Latescibacterota bacterium]